MSTSNEIEKKLRDFIRETFFIDDFSGDQSFLETGLIDSTGMIELIAFTQQSFEIEVEDSELLPDNLDSLSKLTAFVVRKRVKALAG
jgi:acyl carrier protein